jgi:hypothetical protein
MKKIIITTRQSELLTIDKIIPKPAYKDIPKYFKNVPHSVDLGPSKFPDKHTIRHCPSFMDIFKEGMIVYAHCDIYLKVDENENKENDYYWEVPTGSKFFLEQHSDDQFLNYFPKSKVKKVFKLISPFEFIVPRGYSLRQIPLIYDYNPDWHIAYGTYQADKISEVVLQIMFTSEDNEVFIKSGTPLCYLVPYRREEFKYKVKKYTKKFQMKYDVEFAKLHNSFRGSYRSNLKK